MVRGMSELGTGYSPCLTQRAESIEVSASLAINIVEILISILMLAWLARTASTQKSTVLISVDTFALTDGHQCLSTMSCVRVTQMVHHSLPRQYVVWPGTALYALGTVECLCLKTGIDLAGSVARQDDEPKELHTDSIDTDAYDATPSCSTSDADKAAAPAEPPKYIKGRLKAKLAFWKLFCTSTWVLSWISDGYQIPTLGREGSSTSSCLNQQGALGNQEFVSKEIADLLARGSIMQTDSPPLVVSPLNVVEHNGKLRLILDLVYVNYFFLLLFLLF